MTVKLNKWDSATYLKTEEDMAAYFAVCLEEAGDDADLIAHALGVIARARGMTQLLKGAERSTRKSDVLRRLGDLTRSIPVRYGASTAMCEHYAVHFTQLRAGDQQHWRV